jgi:hypothetical protein
MHTKTNTHTYTRTHTRTHTHMHSHTQASSARGSEEPGSRGNYVRTGDRILLQACSSDSLLSLYEGNQVRESCHPLLHTLL